MDDRYSDWLRRAVPSEVTWRTKLSELRRLERTVPSGRIDILAKDQAGATVVIELKAVKAQRGVIGQILAYMSDMVDEFGDPVRGILVAPEFDPKTIAASRMVPSLKLYRYSYVFAFDKL